MSTELDKQTGAEKADQASAQVDALVIRRFRKKPVEIEAIQYTGFNEAAIAKFVGDKIIKSTVQTEIQIHTLEGKMYARPNDWIIKGVKGEFYPCKPDIFEQTYEAV